MVAVILLGYAKRPERVSDRGIAVVASVGMGAGNRVPLPPMNDWYLP